MNKLKLHSIQGFIGRNPHHVENYV